jgi:hypothetical protein
MRAFVSLMKEKTKNCHASISDSRLQRDHSFSSGSLRTQATCFAGEDNPHILFSGPGFVFF